jgi:predicted HTH domain antitoxin
MKEEDLITVKIPANLVADLRKLEEVEQLDRSTAIRRLLYTGLREWKLEYAARLYQENKVTLGRAAEEAGVSAREMMDYLRQKKITMQYDLEDFEEDLKVIYGRMAREQSR